MKLHTYFKYIKLERLQGKWFKYYINLHHLHIYHHNNVLYLNHKQYWHIMIKTRRNYNLGIKLNLKGKKLKLGIKIQFMNIILQDKYEGSLDLNKHYQMAR